MDSFVHIVPEHPELYYSIFYFLAFLAGFAWLMVEGHRRNFPMIPWMLVIAAAFLSFMIGCRWIAYSAEEWRYVLRWETVPYITPRSTLGGILFSIPVIWGVKKFLRFDNDLLDAFARVLPVGVLIQRMGCLMAGCCYGTPSTLPWAVQYGNSSSAFAEHVRSGLIHADSLLTLSIHPVQLYDTLGCILIVVILTVFQKRLKAPGNLYVLSLLLYGVNRFMLEFVRAAGGRIVGNGHWLGLNPVQWVLLLIVPALIVWINFRERRRKTGLVERLYSSDYARPTICFALVALSFFILSRWLSGLEVVSFNVVLVPVLSTVAWGLFQRATVPGLRLASLLLPLLTLSLMSQTLPEKQRSDSTRVRYNTLSFGYGSGSLSGSMLAGYGQGCNGVQVPINNTYGNKYQTAAMGFGRTVQTGTDTYLTFGLNGFAGTHTETATIFSPGLNTQSQTSMSYPISAVSPYMQSDWADFGFGLGFTAGNLTQITQPGKGDGTSVHKLSLLPAATIRIGNLNKFFFEYKYGSLFPTAVPALTHQAILGIGIGGWRKGAIRFGTASNVGFVTGGTFNMGPNLVADVYAGFGPAIGTTYDETDNKIGWINLHYKFNRKYRSLKPKI